MAKKRKRRVKWGRVITVLVALGVVVFLAVQGVTLLFEYISQVDLGSLARKNYVAAVVIDPGHGGEDHGCTSNELLEKDVNLRVSQEIAKVLEKNNIKAVLTRNEDVALAETKNDDLLARTKTSIDNKAMYFVSIHVNAYEGSEEITGYEIYTKNKNCEAIANNVMTSLKEAGFENSRGLYEGHLLYVLRRNEVNAILVEMGYMNSSDFDYLNDEEKMNSFANGIANGIVKQIEEELGLNEVNETE